MEQNKQVFNQADTVNDYAGREYLFPPERKIFARYATFINRARILDLGVGAGRTTRHLIDRCRSYRAIDYASAMIDACRAKFPDHGSEVFKVGDARDLSSEPASSYDFVLFSYNGLDYNQDRLLILAEVRRVLTPHGLFFFSAHSLYAFPFADPTIQARNQDVDLAHVRSQGWALLVDARADCITYYIYPEVQLRQLESAGFQVLEVLDMEGHAFSFSQPPKDWMVHYVCRLQPKTAASTLTD
jgi:SAM-dependent methyltransferase